jgi:hypothetical protein
VFPGNQGVRRQGVEQRFCFHLLRLQKLSAYCRCETVPALDKLILSSFSGRKCYALTIARIAAVRGLAKACTSRAQTFEASAGPAHGRSARRSASIVLQRLTYEGYWTGQYSLRLSGHLRARAESCERSA